MQDYLSAELSATCAALGYYDGKKYHLDRHCLDVIKDLIKYLKRDDSDHTVRRYLGQAQLLQTDLIKIFIQYPEKCDLWDVLLRLMINLTSPALVIYNEDLPTEKVSRSLYQQVVLQLQGYKVALADDSVWTVVSERFGKILNIDSGERGEENELIIERILTLVRNVLQIPPDDNEKRTDNDATIHDEVLFALHASGLVDLLLFIASNSSEQQYHMQILEIISLMLREQSASRLSKVGLERTAAEKERDGAQLQTRRDHEIKQKMERVKKYAGSRHSRFGGTFVVQNMKAIGENQLICHKPFEKIETLEFGIAKTKMKARKKKVDLVDSCQERTSALSVRMFLKEFCVEFLNGAYNPIMRYAKSIVNGAQRSESDTSHYLWALRFFMEFNRHYKFQVKYVSETISKGVFYLVQREMQHCYEAMNMDKKNISLWFQRLHVTLKAYRELLHTLMFMDKSTDNGVRHSAKVIKSNIFYEQEYREVILGQLLSYNEQKMTRAYLVDLIETVHIFLKMLEQFCSNTRHVIVQKAEAKRRKAQKRRAKAAQEERPSQPNLEELWDDLGPEISAVLYENIIPEVRSYDATISTPMEDQKMNVMKKVQKLLHNKQFEQAIGLLRSARTVWPDNDYFGRADMPVQEEFLALREIFSADLGVVENEAETADASRGNNLEGSAGNNRDNEEECHSQEYEYDEEEDEESERDVQVQETDFKFEDFLHRFANVKVVKACAALLQQFEINSDEINHCTVKLLHRIAWECKMSPMVFQASIFRTFQRILESERPQHKELRKFAIFIIRGFIEVAEKNPKSYMELLFWKTSREANDMVQGYAENEANTKVTRSMWSEVEEDELRTLFMEHQTNKYSKDLIDWILENIISDNRTRRGVIKKLKEMSLIVNSKRVNSEIQKNLPKEWSEEEIAQLTEIWEQVKEDDDPVDLIYNGLRIKRTKAKIKEKLLELSLVESRAQLRKRNTKKSNPGKSSWETRSPSPSSVEDDSDQEENQSSRRNNKARGKTENPRRKKNLRKQPVIVYTDAQLSGLLKDVIENDMKDALEWVKESMEEVLEDRDEESVDGIPLVPITDYSTVAMDSPSFQRLLRAIGIQEPANEQEAYWRIPSSMLNVTIRRRCDLIAAVLAGQFILEEPKEPSQEEPEVNSESDDDGVDVFESVKKFFASNEIEGQEKPRPSSSQVARTNSVSTSRLPKKRSDSGSGEHEAEEVVSDNGATDSADMSETKLNSSRIKSLVDSSDSEDDEIKRADLPDDAKRVRSDNSDPETPLTKKRRVLDSDEEDDTERPEAAQSRNTRKIISDDED
ncbi:protein timeless homolog [Cephus cinctus]|uniref:Protein timeless homolog n=1 Tax=Cephus cinctus TaxID=211228 RepID=A0AAJ7FSK1_CEPCN|nr:protein timeless homolog [Cephus cinctus]